MSVYGKTNEPLKARIVTRDRNSSKSGYRPEDVPFRPRNKSSEKDHSFSVVVVVILVVIVILVVVIFV